MDIPYLEKMKFFIINAYLSDLPIHPLISVNETLNSPILNLITIFWFINQNNSNGM
jgi:hypothetical protein